MASRDGIVVFVIAIAVSVLVGIGIGLLINGHFGASLFYIGIGSFILSLIIMSCLTYYSIPANENNKNKRRKSLMLDRKEIRRSIAISFTILYILLISFYCHEIESATQTTFAVNSSLMNKTVINITANSSFTTTTLLNETMNTSITGKGLTGEGLTHLSSVITAFTTIYALIIGFYFGSRVYEKIKEIKDAEETLKIRYIMDEIDSDDFKKKMGELSGIKPNSQLEISKPIKSAEKKITIKHNGGDDIDLKDIRMIIKVNEKKTKFDLIPSDSKKDVFKVTEEMVIDMEKGKKTITVEGIGIIKNDISDDGVATVWKPGEEVEVNVVYKPTKEIISPMKGKIDP